MNREDYRRLSDDGLATITILEQQVADLRDQVELLRAALDAKVDTNPAASPIDHGILIALRDDLRTTRGQVEDLQSKLRRERSRLFVLTAAVRSLLVELMRNKEAIKPAEFNGELYREWNELEDLLKVYDAEKR